MVIPGDLTGRCKHCVSGNRFCDRQRRREAGDSIHIALKGLRQLAEATLGLGLAPFALNMGNEEVKVHLAAIESACEALRVKHWGTQPVGLQGSQVG